MNQPGSTTLPGFLEALGSAAPTPGGGAASALVGAVAAALAEMVAQLTTGRPKFAASQERVSSIISQTRTLRADLVRLMDDDAHAYAAVAAAYKLPKSTLDERTARDAAIQHALVNAMQPPLNIMKHCCEVIILSAEIAEIGNPAVASDAGCAAILGEAAVRAAGLNVLANVVLLSADQPAEIQAVEAMRAHVGELETLARVASERALATVRERMGIAS